MNETDPGWQEQAMTGHNGNAQPEALLDVRELSEWLKFSQDTVRRQAKEGLIPSISISGRYRFEPAAIRRWLVEQQGGKPANVK